MYDGEAVGGAEESGGLYGHALAEGGGGGGGVDAGALCIGHPDCVIVSD